MCLEWRPAVRGIAATVVLLAACAAPANAAAQQIEPPPPGARPAPAFAEPIKLKQNAEPKARAGVAIPPPASIARKPDKPLPADFIRLHLMDGSVIAGRLSTKEIEVETQFGKLQVPVNSITSITPGLVSHPALATEIKKLITDLGSSNYNDREQAQKALIAMGPPVRGELERFQSDNDVERRSRIKAILSEFDELADELDLAEEADPVGALRERDTIATTEFTIVGKIVPQSFVVTSLYGELNVKLADIRKGERDTGKKDDVRHSFAVDASHLAMRSELNTGIRVERGDIVSVTADGVLTMTPWGNAAVSTPDGAQNFGWFIPGQIASGALVGKIGNDSFMKLGSKTSFTAERSGVLQLAIGMQADYQENQFPGKYTVKVRVQRKGD